MSDRVFLDANILVSAAWRDSNGLLALWDLSNVELLTSAYAIVEADRNMRTAQQRTRLHRLVQSVDIVDEPRGRVLPEGVRLPAKDVPILLVAIQSSASHLLTGDKEHFGAYFDRHTEGVLVLRPAVFLSARRILQELLVAEPDSTERFAVKRHSSRNYSTLGDLSLGTR